MADPVGITEDTGLSIYFCDPRSPWQPPTIENLNGLLRQCSTRSANLSTFSEQEIRSVALALNQHTRKTYPPEYKRRLIELVRAGRSTESGQASPVSGR